jgi:novobiocin biosynthesis protein NovU/D-mycarose 3-C-methyltransferase
MVHRTTCRICGGSDLEQVLSLGPSPLANAFLRSADEFSEERSYPLDVHFCSACTLLQLLDVVDPDVLFGRYLYTTGTSETIAGHNRSYARTLVELLNLKPGDLVVEAASNDGSFLQCLEPCGAATLGIEPASNLAAAASASGIETVNTFFTSALARDLRRARQPAHAVVANNVLAHVDDPHDFLCGCRELVADDGLIAIEVPYVADLIERLEYDTMYHEHLSYFSVAALLRLCDRAGLAAVRIDRLPVHGGSLRLYLSRTAAPHAPAAHALEAAERRAGLAGAARYRRFADDVRTSRSALLTLLERLTAEGRRIVGYGAPAKGSTLLNYCGIGTRLLPYTVDRNPLKVGLYTPGTHIPVRELSALSSGVDDPDYVLILAWNLADEIIRQQQAYRSRGGRFIVPVPVPRVV